MIPLRSTERVYSPSVVTFCLIAVMVAVFVYEALLPDRQQTSFLMRYGTVPDRFRPITLFTSMFLHGGWLHLIGNMWFLFVFGRNVEDIMGSWRYLVFFFLCGVLAGIAHVLFNPYSPIPTVGASGAIAGVMGGFLLKLPRARIITLIPVLVFLTTMELPAFLVLVFWFAIQFVSGVGSIGSSQVSSGGVAWFAHVGGFIAGMLLVSIMGTKTRYRRWDLE